MRRTVKYIICLLPLVWACQSIKPYEKEYLLHPLMDDATVQSLSVQSMPSVAAGASEKLAGSSLGGGAASSCPTCGG